MDTVRLRGAPSRACATRIACGLALGGIPALPAAGTMVRAGSAVELLMSLHLPLRANPSDAPGHGTYPATVAIAAVTRSYCREKMPQASKVTYLRLAESVASLGRDKLHQRRWCEHPPSLEQG